jgi:MSHA biogenesis protein MshP
MKNNLNKLNRLNNVHRLRSGMRRHAAHATGGFSLITAIFLLVVLAGLGAALLNVSTVQQAESTLDVQGARVYQAARAGIEWGLYRQLRPVAAPACFGDSSFALPAGSSLSGFTVSVTCTMSAGPGGLTRWQITSTACNQPAAVLPSCPNFNQNSPDYVQRVVQVEF